MYETNSKNVFGWTGRQAMRDKFFTMLEATNYSLVKRGYYMSGHSIRNLVNEFNKFRIEWPQMWYSINIINTNLMIHSAKYIKRRYITRVFPTLFVWRYVNCYYTNLHSYYTSYISKIYNDVISWWRRHLWYKDRY